MRPIATAPLPRHASACAWGAWRVVDLDLQVFDSRGAQVGYSGSWDNSDEIAEFTGTPGETYTIKIRRWSGSDDVWYGIAWTVTGGLFWADATRATHR